MWDFSYCYHQYVHNCFRFMPIIPSIFIIVFLSANIGITSLVMFHNCILIQFIQHNFISYFFNSEWRSSFSQLMQMYSIQGVCATIVLTVTDTSFVSICFILSKPLISIWAPEHVHSQALYEVHLHLWLTINSYSWLKSCEPFILHVSDPECVYRIKACLFKNNAILLSGIPLELKDQHSLE